MTQTAKIRTYQSTMLSPLLVTKSKAKTKVSGEFRTHGVMIGATTATSRLISMVKAMVSATSTEMVFSPSISTKDPKDPKEPTILQALE